MDSEKDAQEALQWKQKYFAQLEESERREKQWQDAEELLRKTISRLTLAADGLDAALDRQLRDLRNAIRDRASSAQLDGVLEDLSRSLVRLDGQRKRGRQDAGAGPLLALLDALSLPKGTARQRKALRRQLQSAAAAGDTAAIEAFVALIHAGFELSAHAAAPGAESSARPGLLQRLFKTGPQPSQDGPGTAAPPGSAGAARSRCSGAAPGRFPWHAARPGHGTR